MLETIAIVMVVLWLLGIVTSNTMGGAWREPGSSDFVGLSRLFGSTNEKDKTDQRTK